jgi:flavin-binding protein dodecin
MPRSTQPLAYNAFLALLGSTWPDGQVIDAVAELRAENTRVTLLGIANGVKRYGGTAGAGGRAFQRETYTLIGTVFSYSGQEKDGPITREKAYGIAAAIDDALQAAMDMGVDQIEWAEFEITAMDQGPTEKAGIATQLTFGVNIAATLFR